MAAISRSAIAAGLLALTCLAGRHAFACACCTDIGQRRVGVEKLDSSKLDEIQKVRFAKQAHLFVGEADPAAIKGVASPSATYDLQVSQKDGGFVFSLRNDAGRQGTLSLSRPESVSVFEVDPREPTPQNGTGPRLYKEWKLTAKATGTGVFALGAARGSVITLILQGHGNSCTISEDFTHWTLVVQGTNAAYSFFGDLLPGSP